MNALYMVMGTTRQAFHQRRKRILLMQEHLTQLLPVLREWRQRHPGSSVRVFYGMLRPDWIGRDRFEQFCLANGFRVHKKSKRIKTTQSSLHNPFPNLLEGRELTGVNQVWVSDITYFRIPRQLTYITVLIDLWSRFIVGHKVSLTLRTTQTTLPALQIALKNRSPSPGLILHSDAGGQYYSQELLELTHQRGIQNSMGRGVYENACAERIHHTIKNQYLNHYHLSTLQELKELVEKVIYRYNYERPHSSLGKLTPQAYETSSSHPKKIILHNTYLKKQHTLVLK
jgi:putative transposase